MNTLRRMRLTKKMIWSEELFMRSADDPSNLCTKILPWDLRLLFPQAPVSLEEAPFLYLFQDKSALEYVPDAFSVRQIRVEYKKSAMYGDHVIPKLRQEEFIYLHRRTKPLALVNIKRYQTLFPLLHLPCLLLKTLQRGRKNLCCIGNDRRITE